MKRLDLAGKYTLITGASSGLGREMARHIAKDHKGHLVVVARRADRLAELATELKPTGVDVVCLTADLTKADDVTRIFDEATKGRAIHAAILNAGVTYFGHGLELPVASLDSMFATNVVSVVKLGHAFLQHQLEHSPEGGVMVVSSVAGTVPTPYQAVYSGTKALLNTWGVALATELAGRPASLTVFAPGGIATEMGELSGTARKFKKGDMGMMDADVCARVAVNAFVRRQKFVVPGALNRLNDVLLRFLPRAMQASVTAQVFKSAVLPAGATKNTPPSS